jgi:amino acid transporter
VATAFAGFLAVLLPLSAFQQKLVAMGVIGLLSLVNYVGVKYGGAVSNVFTTLKVAALAALVLLGFALARGAGNYAMAPIPQTAGLVGSIGLAMSAAFFAYDGWNQSAAVASEIKEPHRNVPLSMLFGVLGVMVVYVLANLAYVYVLPFHDIVATQTLASDVARVLLGPVGATLITIAVLVSTFGTVNAYVLSGPRVYYAMAKDGLSYPGLASVSKRFATPDFAILVQAEWAMLLVLTGSYNSLVNFSVFAILLFYGIATIGFFLLRRREPHTPRPYRTVLYPVVPLVFLATCVFVVVNTLVSDFWDAFWGLVLILTGVPALFLVEWANRRRTQADGEVAPA